jgi:hypothetical protein
MDKFIVEQCGPLKGTVRIGGSKNAVLPVLAGALLTEGAGFKRRGGHAKAAGFFGRKNGF